MKFVAKYYFEIYSIVKDDNTLSLISQSKTNENTRLIFACARLQKNFL